MEIEIESKALISQENYNDLLQKYDIISSLTQVNHYFETEDQEFLANNSAMRVRVKNDTYELTLKIKALHKNIEHNFMIKKQQFEEILETRLIPNEIHELINIDSKLTRYDVISTTRNIFMYMDHKIEVDMTNFNPEVDYEIEIESDSIETANLIMQNLLSDNEIPFNSSVTKLARLANYKSKR